MTFLLRNKILSAAKLKDMQEHRLVGLYIVMKELIFPYRSWNQEHFWFTMHITLTLQENSSWNITPKIHENDRRIAGKDSNKAVVLYTGTSENRWWNSDEVSICCQTRLLVCQWSSGVGNQVVASHKIIGRIKIV